MKNGIFQKKIILFILSIGLFFLTSASSVFAAECNKSERPFYSSFLNSVISFAEGTAKNFGYNVSLAAAPDPDQNGTCVSNDTVGCSGINPTARMNWPAAPATIQVYFSGPYFDGWVDIPFCYYGISVRPQGGKAKFYRMPSSGDCSKAGNVNTDNFLQINSGLLPNTTYNWSVDAAYGGSGAQNTAGLAGYTDLPRGHFTTPDCTPNFSILIWPSPQRIAQTDVVGKVYNVVVNSINGFNSAVNLTFSGCPAGATCTLFPSTVTPPANVSANATLTVKTNNTAGNDYALSVLGTSGALNHSASAVLTVVELTGSLAANPTGGVVGMTSILTANVTGVNAQGNISYNYDCGNGTTISHPGLSSQTDTASCTYNSAGNYIASVVIDRDITSITRTATIIVTNAPDFSISAAPSAIRAPQIGVSSPISIITASPLNGFSGNVNLSVNSGLPASGASPNFNPSIVSLPPAATSQFTVGTSNVSPGNYNLIIRGKQGLIIHDTSPITLSVVNIQGTLSASPNNVVAPLTTTLTANVTGGNAQWSINYIYDCGNGTPLINHSNIFSLTDTATCTYNTDGTYNASVKFERDVANPLTVPVTITVLPVPHTLTVVKLPCAGTNGSGTVTSDPPGIDCGVTCSGSFTGSIALTPLADPGSVFAGWSGACSGTGNCTVTMNSDKTVNAQFCKPGLIIQPSSANIRIGEKINLQAFYDADGDGSVSAADEVTTSASWDYLDPLVDPLIATVDDAPANKKGTVTGLASGTANIKATYNGLSKIAPVTVRFSLNWKEVIPW